MEAPLHSAIMGHSRAEVQLGRALRRTGCASPATGPVAAGEIRRPIREGSEIGVGRREMTGLDALQSVQFVTAKGKRFAVLSAEDWEALVEWLETLEDAQIARQAFDELKAAGGDRKRAGWLEWDAVAGEID
jgi:hypothetical protein